MKCILITDQPNSMHHSTSNLLRFQKWEKNLPGWKLETYKEYLCCNKNHLKMCVKIDICKIYVKKYVKFSVYVYLISIISRTMNKIRTMEMQTGATKYSSSIPAGPDSYAITSGFASIRIDSE